MRGLQRLRATVADTRGVTTIEYALVASLIAIAATALYIAIGGQLTAIFTTVNKDF